jgi:hypothetical protein
LQKRLSNDRSAIASAIQTIISVSNTHSEQQYAAVAHVYFCKSEQAEDDYLNFCSIIPALGERKDLMKRTEFLKKQYCNITQCNSYLGKFLHNQTFGAWT